MTATVRAITFVNFVQGVLRVTLTPAQRVLCLVAFDGVEPVELEGADRELASVLFGPVDVFPQGSRGVVLAVKGARIGGSYILAGLYSLWRALTANLATLAPGEQATALVVAPVTPLARQVLRYALGAARSVPAIARLIGSETSDSCVIRRTDGKPVAIEVLPASRGGFALRGRSLVSAVLSEASFFRDESAVINDSDVFRALAPRVMTGGLIVIESTPWAEQGLVHDLFRANWGSPATCVAAHAPTLLMRPDSNTAALVARERERDPENARREFDAEFMSGGTSLYFGPELPAAIDRTLGVQTTPRPEATVTIGGDIGLVADASAFVAVHKVGDTILLAELLELRPKKGQPLRLSEVIRQGCEFAARHGEKTINVDHHVLEPAREHLPKGFKLDPIAGGAEAKAERFRLLKEALRNGNVAIPGPLSRIALQLADVVGKPTPGGLISITIPRRNGMHGDAAAAFIVAVACATESTYRSPLMKALMGASQRDLDRLHSAMLGTRGPRGSFLPFFK